MVFDPLNYLPLIERNFGALDQTAPLAGLELPEAFSTFHRLMEARCQGSPKSLQLWSSKIPHPQGFPPPLKIKVSGDRSKAC